MSNTHYGIQKRDKPRLRFVKGYNGQNSLKLQDVLPVYNNGLVRSGMIVSKFYNSATAQYEWKIGLIAGKTPYIAENDYDDNDVLGAGGLITAYPLNSEIEIQTPFFCDADGTDIGTAASDVASFDEDAPITAIEAGQTGAGCICIAGSAKAVIGYLSGGHISALLDVASENTNVTRDANNKVLVAQFKAAFVPANLTA